MPSDNVHTRDAPACLQLYELMDGYLTSQLVYVAARSGLADALGDSRKTADALAGDVQADPSILHRVLRGLAAVGVLDESRDGRFGLTTLGNCLRTDVPDSLRGAIVARGDLYYAAAAGLLESVLHGGVPFKHVHGIGLFESLAQNPDGSAVFQASMVDRSNREATGVAAAYGFTGFRRLVDVGGGQGVLLGTILTAAPRLRGVLFDQPTVVESARRRLESLGLAQVCEFLAGDFLSAVPAGGDLYLLSRVIHDWDDDAAVRILTNCRRAMEPGAKLLLVEVVLLRLATEQPSAIRMDLHMLVLLGGRERSAAEYDQLLETSGFRRSKIVPTRAAAGVCVIEAEPVAS
jgi:hypothetical protein